MQEGIGLTLDDVVPLAAGTLPKTSSGKLQRFKTRALYEAGEMARYARLARAWQAARRDGREPTAHHPLAAEDTA